MLFKTGRKGCIVGGHGRLYTVKALRSKIVSTIGAGDAFDAAFIYGDSSWQSLALKVRKLR